jgi:hypothetical protein
LNSLFNFFARTLKDSLENAGEEMNRLHALVAKQESNLETLLKEAESRSEELEELRTNMSKLQVKVDLINFVKITDTPLVQFKQ